MSGPPLFCALACPCPLQNDFFCRLAFYKSVNPLAFLPCSILALCTSPRSPSLGSLSPRANRHPLPWNLGAYLLGLGLFLRAGFDHLQTYLLKLHVPPRSSDRAAWVSRGVSLLHYEGSGCLIGLGLVFIVTPRFRLRLRLHSRLYPRLQLCRLLPSSLWFRRAFGMSTHSQFHSSTTTPSLLHSMHFSTSLLLHSAHPFRPPRRSLLPVGYLLTYSSYSGTSLWVKMHGFLR